MTKFPTPERPGHYWAKLRLHDDPDKRSFRWEVVQVWDNYPRPWCEADIENGECMLASVPGVEGSHALDAFVWGPKVPWPTELGREQPE